MVQCTLKSNFSKEVPMRNWRIIITYNLGIPYFEQNINSQYINYNAKL